MASTRPNGAAFGGRDTWLKTLGKTIVGVLVVAEIGVIVFLAVRPAGEVDPPTRLNIDGGHAHAARHTNEASGLAFDYPAGWAVEDDGDVSSVTSRSRDSVISIGPGPSDDALTAVEETQSLLEQTYSDVAVTDRGVDTIRNRLAITLLGRGVNDLGARVRFTVVALEEESGTVVATEFETGTGRPALSEELRALLKSLEVDNGSI